LSLTADAIEKILELAPMEQVLLNGVLYQSKKLYRTIEPKPEVFKTQTLASLVELINKEHNHGRLHDLIIHVSDPTVVDVYSVLREDLGRFHIYKAVAELPQQMFGQYQDLEKMVIGLKSTFVQSESRDALVTLLGNITEEAVKTSVDDGISQTVTAKTGIATVSKVPVNPIQLLAPYRTFVEVEQPGSEFLLRLQNGPRAAIFEADGGAWKMVARANIKAYFEDKLADLISLGSVVVTE